MNTQQIHAEQEFRIYCEILHGRLQPFKQQFNDSKLLSELIEYANTREINVKVTDLNADKILNTIEYTRLGYWDPEDFVANIRSGSKPGLAIITIIPNKYYLLGDMMDNNIEKPPCYKSRCYLRLIMDEFERIKIRACKLLNAQLPADQLKLIALKNLRTAEYLLRESSAICHFLLIPEDDKQKRSLHYITDCLKKFLIKSILFYHRLFDPYITEFFDQSKNLINNIDRATSSDCFKYVYQDNIDNYCKEPDQMYVSKSNQEAPTHKLQWNGKINLLVSLFYDLTEKGIIKFPEGLNQSESSANLAEFIYHNFLDINGERLSRDTIRTYLNPNKPDKRSKRSQSLNLDNYTS